ncbi:hypothetical protein EXN66_Car016923 [Channa argus]|uniref:Uncharacterized protein n=1 Tax=Channa argus TaxID=215402 RepID=A0A6G1QFA5_CHAAH|nr:hypothetical protein EXN66_Car016923 [Channa argus]
MSKKCTLKSKAGMSNPPHTPNRTWFEMLGEKLQQMQYFCYIYHRSKFQYSGQRPSLRSHGPSARTDSTETSDSLLTCFNQYL